jgi:hypothetical protein
MAYRQDSASSGFNAGTTLQFYNDFLDRYNYFSTNGTGGSSAINFATTAANPGQVQLQVSGNSASASLQTQNFFIAGGGSVVYDNVVQIATLGSSSNRIAVQIGLLDSFGGLDNGNPSNGFYFQYVDNVNSGKWQCITMKAGTATTTSTSVSADTNFHDFNIAINAAGTSVVFSIDGTVVATNTTNIPTVATAIAVSLGIGSSSGANMNVNWDLFNFVETFTTNRF